MRVLGDHDVETVKSVEDTLGGVENVGIFASRERALEAEFEGRSRRE